MSGINVKFGATDAGFTSTVSKVNASMKGMDNNVKNASGSIKASLGSMAKAGAALAVGFGAIKIAANAMRGTIDNFKEALDMGGELSDLSARTGETAGNLMVLRRAFDNTGAGAEKVGPAINKLQRAIIEAGQGSKIYQDAFARLGLNLDALKYAAPTDQIKELANALANIKSPTERSALAMQILGRSGGELLPLLMNMSEEIATARNELGSLPGVMDRSAAAFDGISDKLNVMKGKLTEFAAGMLESAIPALNQFVNAGSELDAAGFGQQIGKSLADAFQMITSGDMWEIFRLHGEKAIASIQTSPAMNGFAALINTIFDGITDTGQGFNFDKSFEKYKNAGVAANDELTAEIEAKMAAIWERQSKRSADAAKALDMQMAETAAKSEIMLRDIKEKPGFTNEIPEWLKRAPDAGKKIEDSSLKTANNFRSASLSMNGALNSTMKMQKLSEQIGDSIKTAEEKSKIDPSGKLAERASEATEQGRFGAARRAVSRIQRREQDAEIQSAFGGDKKGAFGKSVQDLAREQGIDTFRKTSKQLREELAEKAKQRNSEMDARKQGMTEDEAKKGKGESDPMSVISKAVEEIRTLVKKIEPKLPTAALAN